MFWVVIQLFGNKVIFLRQFLKLLLGETRTAFILELLFHPLRWDSSLNSDWCPAGCEILSLWLLGTDTISIPLWTSSIIASITFRLLFAQTWVVFFVLFCFLFLGVLGLRFCARAFSTSSEQGPLFIAVRGPLTVAASLVAEHGLQTCRLSSRGSRA